MKKEINIENYEAFLLDMAEGTISDADRAALLLFLNEHPEIEWDFEEVPTLLDENLQLNSSFKTSLERDELSGLSKLDYLMISSVERTISGAEIAELNELIVNDQRIQKDLEFYQKTILPEEQIKFNQKDQLLQKEEKVIYLWTYVAAAAAAILALVIFNLPTEGTYNPRTKGFAEIEIVDTKPAYAFVVEEDQPMRDKEEKGVEREVIPMNDKLDGWEYEDKEDSPLERQDYIAQIEEESSQTASTELEKLVSEEKVVFEKEGIANLEENEKSELQSTSEEARLNNENTETKKNKSLSPLQYAKKVVKEDVLKNKSLSETLMDEVADLTNDKLKLQKKDKSSPQFALNIGRLKITKK